MKWGLLPAWFKGDPRALKLSMSNCRLDGILDKASFRRPLERGQRCVVLADGFYEWTTDAAGKKQPYFVHLPPAEGGAAPLLRMAGLFDVWRRPASLVSELQPEALEHAADDDAADAAPDEEPAASEDCIWSYTVITVDAAPSLLWLHSRMPAILETDDQVAAWLDAGTTPVKALGLLRPVDTLAWHAADPAVGNIRNNSPTFVQPYTPAKAKATALEVRTFALRCRADAPQSWLKTAKTSPSKRRHDEAAPVACCTCTFLNDAGASACSMCDAALGGDFAPKRERAT